MYYVIIYPDTWDYYIQGFKESSNFLNCTVRARQWMESQCNTSWCIWDWLYLESYCILMVPQDQSTVHNCLLFLCLKSNQNIRSLESVLPFTFNSTHDLSTEKKISTYIDSYTNQKKERKKKKKKRKIHQIYYCAVRQAQYNCESRKGHEKAVRAGPF